MPGSVSKLLLVNVLTCGLELCLTAGTIYIPPLLLQTGMEQRYMTMVLGMGPVLGLVFVPMIGSASDSCRGRFGRRRPFIWLLCVGFLLGLQVMPQASRLAVLFSPQRPRWTEVMLQVGAACLLEFCGQACFTPLEALLSDLFPEEEESRRAFSSYSFMISLGGCLGYLLPAVDWSHTPMAAYVGGQEAFIYALLNVIFVLCILSTTFISEKRWTGRGEEPAGKTPVDWRGGELCGRAQTPWLHRTCLATGRFFSACASAGPRVYGACARVPPVIRRLFLSELCSWMALMSFMLFYTDFLGEGLYQGVPNATPGTPDRLSYDEGVRMASLGLFLQCVTSVVCSLLMERWVALLGARAVYFSSVALLTLATAVMSVSESVLTVTLMAAATGYTFCVLQVLPYTLICLYHSNKQVYFSSSKPRPLYPPGSDSPADSKPLLPCDLANRCGSGHPLGMSLPMAMPPPRSPSLFHRAGGVEDPVSVSQRGMCFDMAILDSAYLLSQVLPALCLGPVVQLAGSVRAYAAASCALSLLALLCSTGIVFNLDDLQR